MAYYLFWPSRKTLIAKGFQSVCDVPCIFDGDWRYDRTVSRYLRERALGSTGQLSHRYPTRQSLETFGRHLTNFLEWCELRGKSWKTVEYKADIVEGYQKEMLTGKWSAAATELSRKTVNCRVDEACRFMRWAAVINLRESFNVLTYGSSLRADSAKSSHGHSALNIDARVGKVRSDPVTISMPTPELVGSWLKSTSVRKGYTKSLMCELVVRTGIRREECVQWRIWTLPKERTLWKRRGKNISVTVEYGAKGQKIGDRFGDERGPVREIMLPVDLAEKLHHYAIITRAAQRARYVKAASTTDERRRRMRCNPNRLFLSDHTFEPVSAASFYKAWTSETNGFEAWSPHLARHYWACQTLLHELKLLQDASGNSAIGVASSWIYGASMDVILLKIQPQLGHISKETTLCYVRWVTSAMGLDVESSDWWEAHLEAGATVGTGDD